MHATSWARMVFATPICRAIWFVSREMEARDSEVSEARLIKGVSTACA